MAERMDKPATNVSDATFADFWKEYAIAARKADEATAVRRNVLKRAKAAGLDTKALLAVAALRKEEPEEVIAHQRKVTQYAIWAGLPVGTQLGLFTVDVAFAEPRAKVKAEMGSWAAEEAGYECGRAGGDRTGENVFEPGTENYVQWDAGWMRGQELIASEMAPEGKKAKKASASRKKPEPRGEGLGHSDEAPAVH